MARKHTSKHAFSILLGLGASATFLWLAVKDVDIDSVSSAFTGAILWFAVPLLLSLMLFYGLKALRWATLLNPIQTLTPWQVLPSLMVGFAANNLLPAHAGELIRVYLVGQQFQIRKSAVLATVVLERILDVVAVLLLVAAALYFEADTQPELMYGAYLAAIATLCSLIFILAYAFWTRQCIALLERLLAGWLKQEWRAKLLVQLEMAACGLQIVKRPVALAGVLLNSIVQWLVMGLCIYLALAAMQIQAPVTASFLVLGLMVAGLSLPSAPGFFGTIELCFVLGLKPYGIDAGQAFSAGVFYHMLAYVSVTGTGLVYLNRLGSNLHKIRHVAETSG
ncbi:MAG: lysylphosphatidylglycerol synthase transmembrane domain-containing protein [Gammaproteobacteria bacterium]